MAADQAYLTVAACKHRLASPVQPSSDTPGSDST